MMMSNKRVEFRRAKIHLLQLLPNSAVIITIQTLITTQNIKRLKINNSHL